MFTSLFLVFLLDALLVGLIVLAIVPLAIYRKAAFAVMKRNFVSYFTTPTGYVFLCLFVLLSSFAAFWPHEFWASNMATLDQLNFWIPLILLLFVPAITMGIWAEERRQGTDELLLTIPADDIDIVLGKYLAAASIFTASLLFSQLANFSVLNVVAEGGVDLGLFFTTYIGYWFMGMAMLAIGMVASFLTSNLTVGFILGALFNVPLALANYADTIFANVDVAQAISRWGMAAQFEKFGRGMITISSVTYFTMIVVTGIYLSVVLIGRRHWLGGKDGRSMLGHYLVRAAALVIVSIAATVFFTNHDFIRKDATSQRINELSPDSKRLLRGLDVKRPVRVEAFISKTLPDNYVTTRYNLINMLKEVQAIGGSAVQVTIDDSMEPLSEKAQEAEDQYGITPEQVVYMSQGVQKTEGIFMAAAFSSGAERLVVPFIGPGTPLEYELVHSVVKVAEVSQPDEAKSQPDKNQKEGEEEATDDAHADSKKKKKRQGGRKTLGIVRTDAQLTRGPNMQLMQNLNDQAIITELRKQYDVEDLTPGDPIDKDEIDVLVVPQPSSLGLGQLESVLDAIRAGIPTAIFEDPSPDQFRNLRVPGTDEPKQAAGGMFGRQQGPQPKCDIQQLWDLLGVRMIKAQMGRVKSPGAKDREEAAQDDNIDIVQVPGGRQMVMRFNLKPDAKRKVEELRVEWTPFTAVVYQEYNPYLKLPDIPDYAVFANPNADGAVDVFNPQEPAVSGLHEALFITPGAFEPKKRTKNSPQGLKFTPLVTAGTASGVQSIQPQPSLNDSRTSHFDRYLTRKMKIVNDSEPQSSESDVEWIEVAKLDNQLSDPESRVPTEERYTLAAHLTGHLNSQAQDGESNEEEPDDLAAEGDEQDADAPAGGEESQSDEPSVNVMLVADLDFLSSQFVQLRNQPIEGIDFQFQNVPLVLNLIDALAGDERFLNIRKRTTHHAPLKLIEDQIREAMKASREEEEKFKKQFEAEVRQAQQSHLEDRARIEQEKEEVRQREELTPQERDDMLAKLDDKMGMVTMRNQRNANDQAVKRATQMQAKQRKIERNLELKRKGIQNQYKAWAVILPPIPPLLVGLAVFIRRRLRESEGVAATRRR